MAVICWSYNNQNGNSSQCHICVYMIQLICILQLIKHTKVNKIFIPSSSILLLLPVLPSFLFLLFFFPLSFQVRCSEALTLINGEPSSALKARGCKWGQIKVEHRNKGWAGWRGQSSAGHSHQSLSASLSQGDNGGRGASWRGHCCFIGLNLTLKRAWHIVFDRLFTHRS